jgi:hypothetical protein
MMIFLRPFMMIFILLCSLVMQAYAGSKQDKAYRNLWHPNYHGQRLNYCALDGKVCGIVIANQYCKKLGYDYASQEILAPNIGLTHYIDSSARCRGWQCNGFMTIGCAMYLSHKPPKTYHYREKRFAYPRANHYRVDWCYKKSKGCGARAANAFCMQMGYMYAKKFTREIGIQATSNIGNQALCFGKKCTAFKDIICYR